MLSSVLNVVEQSNLALTTSLKQLKAEIQEMKKLEHKRQVREVLQWGMANTHIGSFDYGVCNCHHEHRRSSKELLERILLAFRNGQAFSVSNFYFYDFGRDSYDQPNFNGIDFRAFKRFRDELGEQIFELIGRSPSFRKGKKIPNEPPQWWVSLESIQI